MVPVTGKHGEKTRGRKEFTHVGRGVQAEWVLYTKLCTEVALLVYIVRKLSQSVVIVVPPPPKKN